MWYRSENKIELVMIRHGAAASNREHRYLGKTDESLSMEGKQKLQEGKTAYPSIDHLFSSPMKRCLETAQILYPHQEILLIPEWTEVDFGDFEGKNHSELKENEDYQRWIESNGRLPFPNGESREEFQKRCQQGVYNMLSQLKKQDKGKASITVGLILHGGTIMSLLNSFYGGEYFEYQTQNGQGYICTLEVKQGKPEITDVRKLGWRMREWG